jgi:hypothetical protein
MYHCTTGCRALRLKADFIRPYHRLAAAYKDVGNQKMAALVLMKSKALQPDPATLRDINALLEDLEKSAKKHAKTYIRKKANNKAKDVDLFVAQSVGYGLAKPTDRY